MLGVFSEFENNLRRERQMEGINAAKARGVYKGRKPSIKADEVHRLRKEGLGATVIAKNARSRPCKCVPGPGTMTRNVDHSLQGGGFQSKGRLGLPDLQFSRPGTQ